MKLMVIISTFLIFSCGTKTVNLPQLTEDKYGWTYVGQTKSDSCDLYIRNSYVSKDSFGYTIWVKSEETRDSIPKDESAYDMYLWSVNCQTKEITVKQVNHYSSDSTILKNDAEEEKVQIISAAPGSIGEIVVDSVCRKFDD